MWVVWRATARAPGAGRPDPEGIGAQHLRRKTVAGVQQRVLVRREGQDGVPGNSGSRSGKPGPDHGERRRRLRREGGDHAIRKRTLVPEPGKVRKGAIAEELLNELLSASVHRKHQKPRLSRRRPLTNRGKKHQYPPPARGAGAPRPAAAGTVARTLRAAPGQAPSPAGRRRDRSPFAPRPGGTPRRPQRPGNGSRGLPAEPPPTAPRQPYPHRGGRPPQARQQRLRASGCVLR